MKYEEKELKKKYRDYQYCQKDLAQVKEGIKITDDVWNKYIAHIEKLIASTKIKDKTIAVIKSRIEVLNEHWGAFKKAWECEPRKLPKSNAHDYDPCDLNLDQQYINKLLPLSTQKQEFDCFVERITKLHHKVQKFAYSCWLDRLVQFIKTSLLKLYNYFFAGPKNLSGDHYYIDVSKYEPQASHYLPRKHNYFICQEKLSHNTALLQVDLTFIEHWQNLQPKTIQR